ncbi:hypothetical protein [uncultured Mailhella sp.]|uniref:hypothetical protein n=1 Tax=uncultured Mailhella sp. TaxID=1981031 RepID=UPI00320AD151
MASVVPTVVLTGSFKFFSLPSHFFLKKASAFRTLPKKTPKRRKGNHDERPQCRRCSSEERSSLRFFPAAVRSSLRTTVRSASAPGYIVISDE